MTFYIFPRSADAVNVFAVFSTDIKGCRIKGLFCLCSATCWFKELKALLVSTRRTASVSAIEKMDLTA